MLGSPEYVQRHLENHRELALYHRIYVYLTKCCILLAESSTDIEIQRVAVYLVMFHSPAGINPLTILLFYSSF